MILHQHWKWRNFRLDQKQINITFVYIYFVLMYCFAVCVVGSYAIFILGKVSINTTLWFVLLSFAWNTIVWCCAYIGNGVTSYMIVYNYIEQYGCKLNQLKVEPIGMKFTLILRICVHVIYRGRDCRYKYAAIMYFTSWFYTWFQSSRSITYGVVIQCIV